MKHFAKWNSKSSISKRKKGSNKPSQPQSRKFQRILFLFPWARQTSASRRYVSDHESSVPPAIIQLHPSTSSSPSPPSPPTCHETSPLTKYQCYHRRITYSGAALLGVHWRVWQRGQRGACCCRRARVDTGRRSVERQWPEGGERERAATGCWWRYRDLERPGVMMFV